MSTIDVLDGPEFRGAPVGESADLRRILALPRRKIDLNWELPAQLWTKHLRRERTSPCDCVAKFGFCITDLRPVQGWALEEAMDVSGLFAQIAVGEGKTGLDILMAMAIPGVKVALLLIPSNLKAQLLNKDFEQWSAHFKVPNLAGGRFPFVPGRPVLNVLSYHDLQQTKNTDILKKISPDLVICDEVQNVANPESARGKRLLRLAVEAGAKVLNFAEWSGTITKKSPSEYAHLIALSHKQNSPLPLEPYTVEEWSRLLSSGPFVAPPGSFKRLMEPNERPEDAFRRRLTETKGVIITSETKLGVSLSISERKVQAPESIKNMAETVMQTEERPDGEELVERLQVHQVARQIASGFYYRWIYPRGEPVSVIEAWFAARKAWMRELRTRLKGGGEHMDSPALVTKAAIRWFRGYEWTDPATLKHYKFEPKTRGGPLPVWDSEFWPEWERLHKTVEPKTEPVWVDEFLALDAAAWGNESKKHGDHGIIWYEHDTFGQRVAKLGKLKHYGGGTQASADIIEEKGARSIVASIKAHGTGKNLQIAFGRNLMANMPSNGAIIEQVFGRTHRQKQPRDEVTVEVYRHTPQVREAFVTAKRDARYIQMTTGTPQKLEYATIDFEWWRG